MESYLWERERKAELEKELPDGTIVMNVAGSQVTTSKHGYIDFTIALENGMYKQMKITIGIDTSLKSLREAVDKYLKTKELKVNRSKRSNITKKSNRKR